MANDLPALETADAVDPMPPDELRECLRIVGWSIPELARRCDVDRGQPARWENGEAVMPSRCVAWLRLVRDFHVAHPAPSARLRARRKEAARREPA